MVSENASALIITSAHSFWDFIVNNHVNESQKWVGRSVGENVYQAPEGIQGSELQYIFLIGGELYTGQTQ